jgi:hypothetical protein
MATVQIGWRPNSIQQERFLSSPAFEALFGGQAGPGKTECLVMEALRQINNPKYTAIIFRRIFTSITQAQGILQRMERWYPLYGGKHNGQDHVWKFPSGARIYYAHMQHEHSKLVYQGAEYCFVGFDELTEFTESQYLYMFTRCRAPDPALRAYVRNASNPGNIGHAWVKKRFITRDLANKRRWFAMVDGQDTEVKRNHPNAMSRTFIPAALADNPHADPNYANRILATGDEVLIAQLLGGDWDAAYTQGLIFPSWSSTENVTADAEYNPDLPVYWGVDDGYAVGEGPGTASYHPRVILFIQDGPGGAAHVFDEYVATGETHDETLNSVLRPRDGSAPAVETRWHQYRPPSAVYIDGSASAFRGELGKWGLMSVNGTHRVSEGIKVVRQLVQGADDIRRVLSNPRCETFNYEMTVYRSDPKGRADTGEVVPLKMNDHALDGFRYWAWHARRSL